MDLGRIWGFGHLTLQRSVNPNPASQGMTGVLHTDLPKKAGREGVLAWGGRNPVEKG